MSVGMVHIPGRDQLPHAAAEKAQETSCTAETSEMALHRVARR